MHIKCFPKHGVKVLNSLKETIHKNRFILGGGTALALQIGHRVSVDLDFFTSDEFSIDLILQKMQRLNLNPQILQEEKGALSILIEGVKISMLHYQYTFIDKTASIKGLPVAGVLDIAAMKIIAICQRGAKRDFVDLYFILQTIPFWHIAENMVKRFGAGRINPVHIGKSLVFFNDADGEPEPRHCKKKIPEWKIIKNFFIKNVQQIVLDLQKAKED